MIITTTNTIQNKEVSEYLGVVSAEVILGANVLRDLVAGLSDFFGGRAGVYETKLNEGRETLMQELEQRAAKMGAEAVIGVDLDYETIGANGSMLMITASGTAVRLK